MVSNPSLAIVFTRNILSGERLKGVHPLFQKIAFVRVIYSKKLLYEIYEIEKSGSNQGIEAIRDDVKRLFQTVLEIPQESHFKVQATFQRYIDYAVSKTLNFPNSAKREDLEKASNWPSDWGARL